MSDSYHQDIEHWARTQRDHFHDIVDDKNHPTARMIYNNIQHLEDEAQNGKSLRDIHDKMETIEREILQAQHANEKFLSVNHSVDLFHTFQNKRYDVRKHPNF